MPQSAAPWRAASSPNLFSPAAVNLARLLPRNDGRRILVGISTNQRMGKAGTLDVWWPKADGAVFRLNELGALPPLPCLEWAAIWQIELMREAPNIAVEDLEPENLTKALKDMRKMASAGHRAVIAVAGDYTQGGARDDLQIFDHLLQDKLQHLFALMWLNKISEIYNLDLQTVLATQGWKSHDRLPHVSALLGATQLFWGDKQSALLQRKCRMAELAGAFLDALDGLPQKHHLTHEVMMGLQLPQATAEKSWIYIPEGNQKASTFQRMLADVFAPFDMVSLHGLNTGQAQHREIAPAMMHLAGQRNRLTAAADQHYRTLACQAHR